MYLYFLKDSLVPLFRKDKVTLEKHPPKYKEEHNFLSFLIIDFIFVEFYSTKMKRKRNKPINGQWGAGTHVVFFFSNSRFSTHTHTSTHTPRRLLRK
jgi:hypothetical protein